MSRNKELAEKLRHYLAADDGCLGDETLLSVIDALESAEQNDLLAMQEIRDILGDDKGELNLSDIVAKVKGLVEGDDGPDFARMSVKAVGDHLFDNYHDHEAHGRFEVFLNFRWADGTKLHVNGDLVHVVGTWQNGRVCTSDEPDGEDGEVFSFHEFDEYHQAPGAEGGEADG